MLLAYIKMLDLKETIDRVIDLEPPDDKMIKEIELKKNIWTKQTEKRLD